MRLAVACAGAVCLKLTILAHKAIFLRALFKAKLLLAVDHSSEVWFFAFKALIESA